MSCCTPEALLKALHFRYATKKFDTSKKIDPETWSALERSLILTPSSYGLQPWKFLVLTDTGLRESLVEHTWGQRQVVDCSHLVVMAVRTSVDTDYIDRFIARHAEVRGVAVDSLTGYRNLMAESAATMTADWAAKQAYLALGQFMLAAAILGIDTCPMEGFVTDKYDEVLELAPRGLTTAVLCPAGFRADGDKFSAMAKVRWAAEEVIERR